MNGHPAPRRLRLALLDDHEVVRRGIALHLNRDRRFTIVASHSLSEDLITTLHRLPVDVAIIDLSLAPDDRGSAELIPCCARPFPTSHCSLSPRFHPQPTSAT